MISKPLSFLLTCLPLLTVSCSRPTVNAPAGASSPDSPTENPTYAMKPSDSKVCNDECGLPVDDAELRRILTPEQYRIARENGTERPFQNAFWNHHAAGIYVDVISGEPLFASIHKFDSGTGWPSFTQPLSKENIVERKDESHGMVRVEVRSKKANSHLGHLFPDGPAPTRLRYCINSGSLRFIPAEELAAKGLGEYSKLFLGGSPHL